MFFKLKNKDYISICNISQELRRIMPSEELPSCIFKVAQKVVNANDGSISIRDENSNKMDIVYLKENKKHGHAFLIDKINNMVVDKGEPLLFNDLIKEEEFQYLDETNSIKSWLSVPMTINDKIVGVINLVAKKGKKKFDKKDLKLIMIFANQAAAAIQNARDYEKLKELDKLKSEFLTIVSHELRTPLTGIIGFARTLLTLDLSEEQKDNYLKIIESEGKRLSCLVENFLDISKMEAGNMTLQIDSMCLPSMIKEIIEEVEIINYIFQRNFH
jgi:K+-sensing histidine kinase KdpD